MHRLIPPHTVANIADDNQNFLSLVAADLLAELCDGLRLSQGVHRLSLRQLVVEDVVKFGEGAQFADRLGLALLVER